MNSLAAAVRAGESVIDSKKPAKGIVSTLAAAFPCTEKSFHPPVFGSREIARALLQLELVDDVLDAQEFVARHGIGMIVATTDLGEGRLFCMAGSTSKLSEVLAEHQTRTSITTLSPAFIVDALKAGYPCKR